MNAIDRLLNFQPQNQLLDALPQEVLDRWLPHLERVLLTAGEVLYRPGSAPAFVHFPTTAVISLMTTTRDGASAELAVIGHEGMTSILVLMGGATMFSQAVVQASGHAFRLRAPVLQDELLRPGPGLRVLLRYAHAVMAHLAQSVLCNRFHSIEQQLCRRLLSALDRSQSDDLAMTQEGIAQLLGVRREGITAAALKLQQAGVIRYRRGRISVLDRGGLEHRACECYASAKKEHERLLPRPLPPVAPRPALQPWTGGLSLAA